MREDLPKEIKFEQDAREEILKGVEILTKAVRATLGPKGRNVGFYGRFGNPILTKDGVTVANQVSLKNMYQNMGAEMVKGVAQKTVELAGDGPQPLYSKILTPIGWITMGEIKTGMEICGTNMTTQKVVDVFPKGEKEIFHVEFSDGRVVECCEDHLWSVTTSYGVNKVLPVREMINDFKKVDDNYSKYKYYIPKTVVDFKENKDKMPLDPYTLGALIGDGSLSGTGSIELSLGLNKEHIISKIKVPDGIELKVKYCENKNYFRVKFNGKSKNGKRMEDIIDDIGLLGSLSKTKFIPNPYLYSSKESREQLLRGLLDTDGHINERGLYEFSTVSDRLRNDFLDIVRGLGHSTHDYIVLREENKSYSLTPIHRISELKGYNNGVKIVDIRKTGSFTLMQCIKVSNEDNLYITDNYIVTHNTTTATILAHAIYSEGIKLVAAGHNPMGLKRGIDKSVLKIVEKIKSISKPVISNDEIKNIATISSNGDNEIGNLIAQAIEKATNDGIIEVEEGSSLVSSLEVIEGMKFNRGYVSSYFTTESGRELCYLKDPYILICDREITSSKDLYPILKLVSEKKRPLFIIAENFSPDTIATMVMNCQKGTIQSCAVRSPLFGVQQRSMLEDLSVITGARLIGEEMNFDLKKLTLDDLGSASAIKTTYENTLIIGNSDHAEDILNHVKTLHTTHAESDSQEIKEGLRERIAMLIGGVVVIRIGAATETEMIEKKARIDDALCATRAAIEEGIVPGGGVALIRCKEALSDIKCEDDSERFGVEIVNRILESPLKQIVQNAGNSGEVVVNKILQDEGSFGYDAQLEVYGDMIEFGIIDPAKVVRVAIQSAASIAGLMITTEAIIIEDKS